MRHTQVEILRINRDLQQDIAYPVLSRGDISDYVGCLNSFVVNGDDEHLEKRESKLAVEVLEQNLQRLSNCTKDNLIQYFSL